MTHEDEAPAPRCFNDAPLKAIAEGFLRCWHRNGWTHIWETVPLGVRPTFANSRVELPLPPAHRAFLVTGSAVEAFYAPNEADADRIALDTVRRLISPETFEQGMPSTPE